MSRYIKNLILQGENQHLDFKYEITDAQKIAKTFSAFANTEGGTLLIGVKDNGNIIGIHTDEEYYMAETAAQFFCRPEVKFKTRRWDIDGKTILEVIIPKSKDKPHCAKSGNNKWIKYIRVKDQNLIANNVISMVWEKGKNKKGVFIKYTKTIKTLLEFLEKNEFINLSGFCQLTKIKKHNAEEILSDLISLQILKVEITEKAILYMINRELEYNTIIKENQ